MYGTRGAESGRCCSRSADGLGGRDPVRSCLGCRVVLRLILVDDDEPEGLRRRSPDRRAGLGSPFAHAPGQRLEVVDLAGVGVGQGVPTLDLCRRLRAAYPKLELISGGGVRGVDDLKALRDAGCDAALVASALHDGRLTRELLDAHLAEVHTIRCSKNLADLLAGCEVEGG